MKNDKECLAILSKLMNEEIIDSIVNNSYEILFDYIHTKVVSALDDGSYTANAEIMKRLDDILAQYTIFNAITELCTKQIIAVRGSLFCIENALMKSILGACTWVRNNTNVPTVILPGKGKEKIYALTYMNKLVGLNNEEYKLITGELYKNNIEVRKLIKCFVVYTPYKYEHVAFFLLPQYMEKTNDVYEQLMDLYGTEYVYIDSEGIWEKVIRKVPQKKLAVILAENMNNFASTGKIADDTKIYRHSEFSELCEVENRLTINHYVESLVLNAILDADVFYTREIEMVSKTIEQLTKDSLMLEEGRIKSQVASYKNKLLTEMDQLQRGKVSFLRAKKELLEIAKEYENSFSKSLMYDLPKEVNANKYIENLLEILFKYVKAENREGSEQVLLKLRRANYSYLEACEAYCNYMFGQEVPGKKLQFIQSCPNERWEISKIKVALCKQLNYKYDDLKLIVGFIGNHLDNGAEFFFMGKRLVDKKEIREAREYFESALYEDYPKAGHELISLAKKYPDCGIDIEELAENLVPEANYFVGCQNLFGDGKYKKGIVNIKMAASKEYIEAVVIVADMLFGECKHISWQEMRKDTNIYKVNNVIRLYEFLEKKNKDNANSEKIYLLRIGLMYCKLNEYSRAYGYLKNIIEPEAQYECAKMYQYGNGVARDLKTALKHYEQIKGEYKDSAIQLAKVRRQIAEANQPKERSYTPTKSYSSSSHTSSSSSSYCFITTAACFALSAERNCEELNQLRWFRDMHILGHGQDGKELVDEYYRIGPNVVKNIDTDWNPFAVYEELWEDYILPSCKYIKEQMWNKALHIYIEMVKHMCEKYSVPVMAHIKEKYSIDVEIANE